ncbi:GNAT family N-acetyltransferase [Burkholderia glumae]|uniref:GNAT family N-acetyltransferase n=1 Tax=Burkholderia glumae TaxID=337 RepID=A0AAP9Y4V7_BURGL|nr:GNAT family N-acetyltransferase [Burkholderia glumae]ACR28116.1 Histone acetyltransferase HPA [Burkholderia glumae BGR1]AJY65778.1 acetyltransferase domain protein [Burkholderia glumae LMG 2196 = ATCC 33617]KHJ64635.1 GCN5 family acetyltransferase [Burkholderia glumae]MCM2480898.1 GNAT family N-acetyltransferase [Burkholderia glumae]MCM2492415.1 GNAT family N-acetyltransferase [Burkholderia glumae]
MKFEIRDAAPSDVAALIALTRELAEFEALTHLFVATEADLADALFGPNPAAGALVATQEGDLIGYALYFQNYSTFVGKRGLYLEDLYVKPTCRGTGLGTRLLRAVAALAVERGCGRFEWTVLDWNRQAIEFYERMGAVVLPDWRVVRVTGDALDALAQPLRDAD